jgi:hypothetical protein
MNSSERSVPIILGVDLASDLQGSSDGSAGEKQMQKPVGKQYLQVDKNLVTQTYNVYLVSYSPDGKTIGVVKNVEMEYMEDTKGLEINPHQAPILELRAKAAQELLDELWSTGLRPSHVKAPNDQIRAMQAHIDDLRWIIKAHIVGDSND